MAYKFPNLKYAKIPSQGWLDGATSISFFARFRIDDLVAAAQQHLFSHTGPTGQFSLRKDSTGKLRISVTTGGIFVVRDHDAALSQDTIYDAAGIWKPNHASGLRLWQDGTQAAAASSTTSQTSNYDSGGTPDLFLGCKKLDTNYARSALESLLIVRDYEITQDDIDALRAGIWPQALTLAAKTHVFYPLFPEPDHFRDLGGNDHDFASTDIFGAEADDYLGRWDAPQPFPGAGMHAGAEPAGPGDWIDYPHTIPHPDHEIIVSGLTNGQEYDFRLIAEDAAANQSTPSAEVSATPLAAARHIPRPVFLFSR